MPGPNSGDTEGGGVAGQRGGKDGVVEGPGVVEGTGKTGGAGVVARRGRGGEFAALGRLASRLAATGARPAGDEVWMGDDTAVLEPPRGRLLLTTDLSVAGVHGDLGLMTLADFGWRAFVASLSDIAAMGGLPRQAVVAVAGPPATDLDLLYDGIAAASEQFGCPVVGGDLSGGAELAVAVAMTGGVPAGAPPVLRSGARPGDGLFVTGPLGAAAAGLRLLRGAAAGPAAAPAADTRGDRPAAAGLADAHRRPQPRMEQGTAARLGGASAMIDVSDGLVADLGHVAAASGVGFRLADVPVASGAQLDDALYGGEDYQLVLACPDAGRLLEAFAAASLDSPLRIGTCTADPGEHSLAGTPLAQGGWEHGFSPTFPSPGSGRHRPRP